MQNYFNSTLAPPSFNNSSNTLSNNNNVTIANITKTNLSILNQSIVVVPPSLITKDPYYSASQ
jgi:hypothetical protein